MDLGGHHGLVAIVCTYDQMHDIFDGMFDIYWNMWSQIVVSIKDGEPFFLLMFKERELKREYLVPLEMEGMAHFGGIVANEDNWRKQVVNLMKGAL